MKLYKPSEAANELNISTTYLAELARKGAIESEKTSGGHRRYTAAQIESAKKVLADGVPTETMIDVSPLMVMASNGYADDAGLIGYISGMGAERVKALQATVAKELDVIVREQAVITEQIPDITRPLKVAIGGSVGLAAAGAAFAFTLYSGMLAADPLFAAWTIICMVVISISAYLVPIFTTRSDNALIGDKLHRSVITWNNVLYRKSYKPLWPGNVTAIKTRVERYLELESRISQLLRIDRCSEAALAEIEGLQHEPLLNAG